MRKLKMYSSEYHGIRYTIRELWDFQKGTAWEWTVNMPDKYLDLGGFSGSGIIDSEELAIIFAETVIETNIQEFPNVK